MDFKRRGAAASRFCIRLLISFGLSLPLVHGPAFAGDPSGLDEATMDQCIAAAATEGGVADCTGTGVAACKTVIGKLKPDLDAFTVLDNCTDAERQFWEARLTTAYEGLIAKVRTNRPEEVETVRAMERAWIAFRDARCAAERGLYGHGTGGAIAVPECLVKETARQVALLIQLQKDE